MNDAMKNIAKVGKVTVSSWGEFFSDPTISALSQVTPISAAIAAFFGGAYQSQQFETMEEFLHLLHARLQIVEQSKVDKNFYSTVEGRRILGKALRSIFRDNRNEKLNAMANLTVNLTKDFTISVDEKELYVDILDSLNSLQLSILEKAVIEMRVRQGDKHRGLGWQMLADEYSKLGISKPLFLQALRVLESAGLINENTATVAEADKTHFITEFGEQFYNFVSEDNGSLVDYL